MWRRYAHATLVHVAASTPTRSHFITHPADAASACLMDPALFPPRRRRNRPSLHYRVILIRQRRVKIYRRKQASAYRTSKARDAYYATFAWLLSSVLGTFLLFSSLTPYAAGSGGALLCYCTYTAASLFKHVALPSFEDACRLLGIDGLC